MNAHQGVGQGGEFVRQARRAGIDEIDDQRAAPASRRAVRSRRADGACGRWCEMAKRFGLHVQARRRRGIAFMRISDASQQTAGQRT